MRITPSADNYALLRGRLLFNRKVNGVFQGLRDLGNATDFTLTTATDKLDHYSMQSGVSVKDKSVIKSASITGSFTLEEIVAENLALSFLADIVEVTRAASPTDETFNIAAVKKGYRYQLPDVFVDPGTSFSITKKGGGPAYVKGTDYTIHGPSGQIYITANSPMATHDVDVKYRKLAKTYQKLNAFKETSISGELHFISDVSEGTNLQNRIWSVTLTPDGDTGLISEEWAKLKFGVEINSDAANHPNYPYMEVIVHD